jgi:hypothetical protein
VTAAVAPVPSSSPSRPGEAPPRRSVFSTWWFWTGVGVVAVGAGVTVFALSQKSTDAPHTDGGTLRFP